MNIDKVVTIKLNGEEVKLLAAFIERNVEANDNFDLKTGSSQDAFNANSFARKLSFDIQ